MEEVVFGFLMGVMFAVPFGWFLRSAAQWRREAKRAEPPVVRPVVMPAPAAPENPRLEMVLERLTHRLESVEERIDFTEQLLDTRSAAGTQASRPNAPHR